MKKLPMLLMVVSFLPAIADAQATPFALSSLFTDNMVLQQRSDVPIWGKGVPGTRTVIQPSWGKKKECIVQQDGRWMTTIATTKAGGPYTMTVMHADTTVVLKNILLGEVWLCSGQSNMEMPLEGWPPNDRIDNAEIEIQQATHPAMRLFTVSHAVSPAPLSECSGTWKECTPDAAAKFSAVGYFFGKKLTQELKNVPIGLIQSTWGGTPVEAWTSEKFISGEPEYVDIPKKIKFGKHEFNVFMTWLTAHRSIDVSERNESDRYRVLDFGDSSYALSGTPDTGWATMRLPGNWENTEVGNLDGVVWFRKNVHIPRQWIGKELVMELGPIDDFDQTYANGVFVGGYQDGSAWNVNRVYDIPAAAITDSTLTVAIRVVDIMGGGGLWGKEQQLRISAKGMTDTISLAGMWKYLVVAEYRNSKFYQYDVTANELAKRPAVPYEISFQTPTALYNGMIAPLVPYAIRGAIWYQGEGNVPQPEAYKRLFPLMIRNWRSDWNSNFPLYYTQIAPYSYGPGEQSQRLREAQFVTLHVPKTGMAVTLDIGSAATIHPGNKIDVGERLARLALANDYRKNIPFSGPVYTSCTKRNGTMVLSFKHADKMFLKMDGQKTYFSIAGDDSVFHPAEACVKDKTVIVHAPEVRQPIAVRYAWDNVVQATLFNGAGLPASSFRTDAWQK